MAAANQWWMPVIAKARAFGVWLRTSLKSQWLAATLIIPLAFFVAQTHVAREDAKEARKASVSVDRISKLQESGKALDLALASYYQSIAELGLAERHIKMPGTFAVTPIKKAQTDLVEARLAAQKAMGAHAGDVESLRGVLDPGAASKYVSALADVNAVLDGSGEIKNTGANITVISRLAKARNELVDSAISRVS